MNTKKSFEKVNDSIYVLKVPFEDTFVGITLVLGSTPSETVLIDAGPNESVIKGWLIPALSEMGMTLESIGNVTVTHCHRDNIGGLSELVRLAPNITVAAPKKAYDRIQNPMQYLLETHRCYPDDDPSFEEIRGVFVTRAVGDNSMVFGLKPIPAPGHSADSICWFHEATKTLICGDALQGYGAPTQGLAYIESLKDYRKTLKKLSELEAEYIVCSHDMDEMEFTEHSHTAVIDAINKSAEAINRYTELIRALPAELDERSLALKLLEEYGKTNVKALSYSMFTVHELKALRRSS